MFKVTKNPAFSALIPGIAFFNKSNPKNKRANPIKTSPKFVKFVLLIFLIKTHKYPIPKIGMASFEILKEKPKRVTIHAVIVVPIFAPKITPTDCAKVINPAFTKETTITVVAPDD